MIYLYCGVDRCFDPIIDTFKYILDQNNIDSVISPVIEQNDDLWFVIWNKAHVLPKRCIIYNLDPTVEVVSKQMQGLIARSPDSEIVEIVNYCYGKTVEYLNKLPYPCSVMPYGYSKYHQTPDLDKDIDVLFYGNVSPRRRIILHAVNELCSRNGYKFVCRYNNLYNQNEKLQLIARSRIVVSFASEDAKQCETNDLARSSQVISSGNFIITEFIGDKVVEGKMKEYVPHFSTTDELLQLVEFYLENPQKRLDKIGQANQFKNDFDLESMFIDLVSKYC